MDQTSCGFHNYKIPASEPQISPEDPEVKKVTVLATKSMEHSSLLERIAFSDWYRTKRAIAICQLFIERMKFRAKKRSDLAIRNDVDPPLEGIRSEQQERSSKGVIVTVNDLQRAELLLIKEVNLIFRAVYILLVVLVVPWYFQDGP